MDDIMKITLNDGKEEEYNVIFTFFSNEYNKNYIVYTDETKNINDELNVYCSIYENNKLIDIEDDKEYDMVSEVIDSYMEKSNG